MKILVTSQHFWPEEFRINDLVTEWIKQGYQVTVLTGKPNYPQGKIYAGYKFWGVQKEDYQGAEVIRIPLIPRGSGSRWRLVLNYCSYVLFASWYLLFHKKKFDIGFAFLSSPITQAFITILNNKLYQSRTVVWIQDLWPESVSAAGKIKQPIVMWLLNKMVTWIYRHSDKILVQSGKFKESILAKGDFKKKLVYIPNWAEDFYSKTNLVDESKYKKLIPEGFIIMFAGNIGVAQDFDSLINAAKQTREYKHIKWVVIGDGRYKPEVERQIKEHKLEDNFILLGRYPVTEMPHFFVHADAMLLSLKDEYIFSLVCPSKLQSYMASGKPVLSMLSGVGSEIVECAECGLIANAGDYKKLADNAIKMSGMNSQLLQKMGINGRAYFNKNFSKKKVIANINQTLKELVDGTHR